MRGSPADTIAALATPEGAGLRALLRVSGPRCREIARRLVGDRAIPDREGWPVQIPVDGARVPATLIFFSSPKSYTREDMIEIALPSSPPLVALALRQLGEWGARAAEPGEFTRRAFANGRIDLARAEGVLELVRARNAREVKAGLLLMEGGLSERVRSLRMRLEGALALVEASLDFEESDTGHVDAATLLAELAAAGSGLAEATLWEDRRAVPRGAFQAFLWGEPNAGKSSLLNRLDPQASAIVSPVAGTTRDCLRGFLREGGIEISILDAAGVERGTDALSAKAQEMARRFRESSDWVLGVADGSRPLPRFLLEGRVDLLVANKSDLPRGEGYGDWNRRCPVVETSALRGEGIDALREAILSLARREASGEGERLALSQRHRGAIQRASQEVEAAREMLARRGPLDATAAHLREALAALGEIDGETTPEDILDRIFSQFCIGK